MPCNHYTALEAQSEDQLTLKKLPVEPCFETLLSFETLLNLQNLQI